MQIIPNTPYKTESKAENRVFDKLRESFVNSNNYLAFHSLNLTKHKTKKFGEADFVILCEFGIFVLEVKGGRISSDDGAWYTINRHNETYKIQDPFRQAEGALHAIKDEIKNSNIFFRLEVPIGYGVIFPDVEWTQIGSEWDLDIICDSKKFRNFEAWLKKLFYYWGKKPRNNNNLTVDNIQSLKQFLRPNFELIEPLYVKLENLKDTAVTLTEDQYRYLDIVEVNKQVLCSGGAGTGKTFLAAELARRMENAGKSVVLVCKSNWLRRYLETRIQNEYVTIATINSVKMEMKRSGVDKYNVLIIDEGQDLFGFDEMELLDEILEGGLDEGEWYIFHDVNNQHGLFIDTKMEVLDFLESFRPAKVPLVTNCRNSGSIIKKVQKSLNMEMGNTGTGSGPEVHETIDKENNGNALKNEIKNLLKLGATPGSITILSPLSYEKSSVSLLFDNMKRDIIKLDDYSVRSFPIQEISFS